MNQKTYSRGGSKPPMLGAPEQDIPVHTYTGEPKFGLYQVGSESGKKVLARLVEVPSWLSDTCIGYVVKKRICFPI